MKAKSPAASVLFVDDEVPNQRAFKLQFEDHFRIATASGGAEALQILESGEPIGVLLTDQRMPDMTGVELCAVVRERFPEVVRIVVTAYTDADAAVGAINRGQVNRYVMKPWREEQMLTLLRAGLEAYELATVTRDLQARLLRADQGSTTLYLLSEVMHEMGNPAAAVANNADFMIDTMETLLPLVKDGPREVAELIHELHDATKDILEASRQLLARFERFRQGGHPLEAAVYAHLSLTRAVNVVAHMFRMAARERAALVVDAPEDVQVYADDVRLNEILMNLLVNAIEAIPKGEPERHHIWMRVRGEQGHGVVEIEDTGVGITAAQAETIFDPFVTGKERGRGLGLAIVRDLVRRGGGRIEVKPGQEGRGAKFTVHLPRDVQTAAKLD